MSVIFFSSNIIKRAKHVYVFYSCELTFFVHLDHIIPNLFVKGPLENFETIMAGNKKIQNPKNNYGSFKKCIVMIRDLQNAY